MKYILLLFVLLCMSSYAYAQDEHYQKSYHTLSGMLSDSTTYNFKKAVFSVENAYLKGTLDSLGLEQQVRALVSLAKTLINNRKLLYNGKDVEVVKKHAAIFSIMTDSIPLVGQKNEALIYIPYQYDFNDPFGHEQWENMFVSKLLQRRNGNCHSLPYLYKILAEELGVEAHLALAPNHVYIKLFNEKDGWVNTELTSGFFPRDAWLMASGYVHLNAIKNGVYLKALNNKESIALCLVDLALGYSKELNYDPDFVLQCVDKALSVFPNYANALVLKTEAKGKQLQSLLLEHQLSLDQAEQLPQALALRQEIEQELQYIHELGYRQMPESMYLAWLLSLKTEEEKYATQKLRTLH